MQPRLDLRRDLGIEHAKGLGLEAALRLHGTLAGTTRGTETSEDFLTQVLHAARGERGERQRHPPPDAGVQLAFGADF